MTTNRDISHITTYVIEPKLTAFSTELHRGMKLLDIFPLPPEDRDRFYKDNDAAKASFLNIYFHRCFMTRWNSGINTRNYENYARDIRASLGYSTVNRSETFRVIDRDIAHARLIEYAKNQGLQVIFGNRSLVWVIKVVSGFPTFYAEFRPKENEISVVVEGDADEVITQFDNINELFPKQDLIHVEKLTMMADQSLSTSGKYIPRETTQMGKDYYYPWLGRSKEKFTLQSFADEFSASSSNALLLYGERGTGKSTFIRTLMFLMGRRSNVMVTDEPTMRSQAFRSWLESADENAIIALEDADNLVKSRESGNDAMVALLNITNGVIPKNCKIIVSTNLPNLNQMDTAFTRLGRMFSALHFQSLSSDEAMRVRELDGLPKLDIKEELTLAETLNFEHLHREFKKTGFGFGTG